MVTFRSNICESKFINIFKAFQYQLICGNEMKYLNVNDTKAGEV